MGPHLYDDHDFPKKNGQFPKYTRNSSISILFQKQKLRLGWIRSACFKLASLYVLLNSGRLVNFETIIENTLDNNMHLLCLAQQWGFELGSFHP